MRRGRIFIYLALILILGIAAFFLVGQKLLAPKATPKPTAVTPIPTPVIDKTDVVFVGQPVSQGTVLNETHLYMVPYPRELLVAGMFTDMAEVVGRTVRFDLQPGIPVTNNMLLSEGETPDTFNPASVLVPNNMLAVSIPISRLSSVSYAPRRGDHVNVIVTLLLADLDTDFQTLLPNYTAAVIAPGPIIIMGWQNADEDQQTNTQIGTEGASFQTLTSQITSGGPLSAFGRAVDDLGLDQTFYLVPSEAQRPRLVSQTLIQNAIVLQTGTFNLPKAQATAEPVAAIVTPTPTPEPQQNQVVTPTPTPKPPDVITIIVKPQDAVTLNYLLFSGAQLSLALRNPEDNSTSDTQAVTLDFLLGEYSITLPVKLPYGIEPRVDELVAPTLKNDLTTTTVNP